jgi:O-antigen/teichoic acid export membrane protein
VSRTDRALAGWFWLSSGTGAQALLTIIVIAVLARLLSPSDFGVVSASLLVINFCLIFSQGLVGPALVQHAEPGEQHLRTVFSLSLISGFALLVLLWWLAPAIATLFGSPALVPVLRALAWVQPIQALAVVSDALLRRALAFRILAGIRVASYALGYGLVGIGVALVGGGLWALVAAYATQATVTTLLLVWRQPVPTKWGVDRAAARELLLFGGGFSLARIGNYAAVQGDNFVAAKWLGVAALGLYERAYQLMAMPATLVGQVLDDVLFPAMAQIQFDSARLALAYRRCVAGIALLTLPLSAVTIVLAPELIYAVLGPKWGEVALPFQLLAVGTLFRTSYKVSDSLTRAVGAVYRRAWRQWIYAALVVGGAVVGQRWGITGIAAGVVGALLVNFLLMAQLSTRLVALRWADFLSAHSAGLRLGVAAGLPTYVTATLTRAVWGRHPFAVLGASLAASSVTLGVLFWVAPAWSLGEDGRWLWDRLARLLMDRLQRARPAPRGA